MVYNALREIIYVNTDDFCASVMRVKDVTLRSRPVIVAYLSSRGSVVGASYEAREAGVHAGMATTQAQRVCPQAVFIQVDWKLFQRISRAIFAVVDRYSPLVEPVGLDEGFLDYTGCSALFGGARDIARHIQKEVAAALSLDVSLGLGANKLVSQVASKAAKLAGIVHVPPGEEGKFLERFPVGWLPGVSAARADILVALGVKTIGKLAQIPIPLMERAFGPLGKTLVERARGMDNRPVLASRSERMRERLQAGITFADDLISLDSLDAHLYALAEALGRELRRSAKGARKLKLGLTYTDGYCATHTTSLPRPTTLDMDIYREAHILFRRAFRRRVRVRALYLAAPVAVSFMGQGDLFLPKRERLVSLYQACDRIREKYGEGKVLQFGKTFLLAESALGFSYSSQR